MTPGGTAAKPEVLSWKGATAPQEKESSLRKKNQPIASLARQHER